MSAPGLLSWLRSTVEGDKAVAEALEGERWSPVKGRGDWHIQTSQGQSFGGGMEYGELDPNEADHIQRHDPRDTIARCTAELAQLDHLAKVAYHRHFPEAPKTYGDSAAWAAAEAIRRLAVGYQHRPGFDADWLHCLCPRPLILHLPDAPGPDRDCARCGRTLKADDLPAPSLPPPREV